MIARLFSNPRFLAVYSGVLTLTLLITAAVAIWHPGFALQRATAAEKRNAEFDQLTVHRITVVEGDGTPRLIIAGKDEFPGAYFRGKDIPRSDRAGYAGMIFMDDEGTENGGLVFGGRQSTDGASHSFGHLSFDEYQSNQTLALDTNQQGDNHNSSYSINDNDTGRRTPEVLAEMQKLRELPDSSLKKEALAEFATRHHIHLTPRGGLERMSDKSIALRLRDTDGNTRILLSVAGDGTPSMRFLDAAGKVTRQWPEVGPEPRK